MNIIRHCLGNRKAIRHWLISDNPLYDSITLLVAKCPVCAREIMAWEGHSYISGLGPQHKIRPKHEDAWKARKKASCFKTDGQPQKETKPMAYCGEWTKIAKRDPANENTRRRVMA